eukprot:TRINITY_DN5598_c0_g1_i4.p1 TRINITY_DN5598_c0_g1~~TRINITY_DN5598_c0_g1_i4.p1  ORF type:complete len:120 (-),score=8.78 TRINITY_DN5598_c0_g1_i4:139-498(-)
MESDDGDLLMWDSFASQTTVRTDAAPPETDAAPHETIEISPDLPAQVEPTKKKKSVAKKSVAFALPAATGGAPSPRFSGITNLGNSCFAGATIQLVRHTVWAKTLKGTGEVSAEWADAR